VIFRLRLRLFPLRRAARATSAPARRRAARRALVWGAVVVLFAHVGLAIAVETVLPQVRDPEYGYRQVRAAAKQKAHPDRPLVLVLGTSRTQNAIDPSAMSFPDELGSPLVFNGGVAGSSPVHLRLTLQRFRTNGVRPAAVLVELFPAVLHIEWPVDVQFADARRLTASDLHQLEPDLILPDNLRRRWALSRMNPWHEQRQILVGHLAPVWQPLSGRVDHLWDMQDRNGYLRYPEKFVTDESRSRKRSEQLTSYADALARLRVSELTVRTIRGLVADCRAAGIPVAFFFTPESPIFRGVYAPESRAALGAFVRTLPDELGCPVFEAPLDYTEEDFADGTHMLSAGARRFSQWLAETHLRPWLAGALK
jgi:hypothetical protein